MTTYSLSRGATSTDRAQDERGSATTHDLLDHRARRREALARTAAPATNPRREPVAKPTAPAVVTGKTAGPIARLRALPQPTAGQLATLEGLDEHLADLEAARQAQLDTLSANARTAAAAAHRETVAWILEQIRAARHRLCEDLYGLCARCGAPIGPERVNMQPWQTTCNTCAPPDRPVLGLPRATGR